AMGRPWIHAIQFLGVKQVKQSELREKIVLQATSRWPFAPKQYLDAFAVDDDRARIESFYRAHGFFDAKVQKSETLPRKNGKSVDIRIAIDEGQPTKVVRAQLTGLPDDAKLDKRVEKRLQLSPGKIFDHE